MRRILATAALSALLSLTALAPGASAARPPVSLGEVTADFLGIGSSECGDYCVYDAIVEVTSKGPVRLVVNSEVQGRVVSSREEVAVGSGTRTVNIGGLAIPLGDTATFEVGAYQRGGGPTGQLVASATSEPVTCSLPS